MRSAGTVRTSSVRSTSTGKKRVQYEISVQERIQYEIPVQNINKFSQKYQYSKSEFSEKYQYSENDSKNEFSTKYQYSKNEFQ